MFLGSTSMAELQDRIEVMNAASVGDASLLRDLTGRHVQMASQRAMLDSLEIGLRAERDRIAAAATDLGSKLTQQQEAIARLARERTRAEALVRTLKDRRQRELAEQALARTAGWTGSSITPPPPLPGTRTVRELIVHYFHPLGNVNLQIAMCVGYRESRYQPGAVNPSSGAAGVFQFMPAVWPEVSRLSGWGGASVFDAQANVAVAAWTVGHYGWWPWKSDSGYCPV